MRVKICGVKTPGDIDTVVKSGADAAGFLVGQLHSSSDFILPSTAGRLASLLPPYISPILVTHLKNAEDILEIAGKSSIPNVQLHGDTATDQVARLRDGLPALSKIIYAVNVKPGIIPELDGDLLPLINAVLLDSGEEGKVGGTGRTHDWRTSAQFVSESTKPVILAGGLHPGNVAEAVSTVRPYGVDANSKLKAEDGGRDPILCAGFVYEAKKVFFENNRKLQGYHVDS